MRSSKEQRPAEYGRRVWRWISATLLALAMALGGISVAAPAQAAGGVYYGINVNAACAQTWNDPYQTAYVVNLWSPYSWVCAHQRVGYPYEFWYEGGADFQAWCSRHYPGSAAVIAGSWYSKYPAFQWSCRADHEISYR